MDIQHLIIKSVYAALNDEERQQMDTWLHEAGHQALYDRIVGNLTAQGHSVEDISRIDVEAALLHVKEHAENAASDAPQRHFLIRKFYRVAAIAALIVGFIAGVWWYQDYTRVTPPSLSAEVIRGIHSAARHDQLLADDEARQPSAPLSRKELKTFGIDENAEIAEEMMDSKRIKTYINKEYWVTLPDGTMVHLADNSSLIYPDHFGRGDRNVCLEGEGYFMVAHDKSRHFIVHTPHGQVCDYGTEFDVNTRDASGTSVILVSGSVGVIPAGGREQLMQPGQKAEIISGGVALQHVDTMPYIAWNTGKIDFHNWTIHRIMTIISKWYNRRVVFHAEQAEQKTFSGTFDRYDGIESTIEAIRAGTDLRIEITKDQLIVY